MSGSYLLGGWELGMTLPDNLCTAIKARLESLNSMKQYPCGISTTENQWFACNEIIRRHNLNLE